MERYRLYQERKAYMVYMTDQVRLAPQGKVIGKRWIDMIDNKVEDVNPDEVLSELKHAGLEVIE